MRNEQDDLKKLADAFFDELTLVDLCGIGTDPYRPFGYKDWEASILELIEWEQEDDESYSEDQYKYAYELYMVKLIPYLREKWKNIK